MRYEEANDLVATLNAQALTNCSFAADGKTPLTFKAIHPNEGQKGRLTVDGWTVKAVELVEETNLQSGLKFWIDRDTPNFLNPARDAYYD